MQRISENGTPENEADDPWLITMFKFNVQDLQTDQSRPFKAIGEARYTDDAIAWLSHTEYSSSGNITSTTDSAGNITRFEQYDQYGNPGRITDALGNTTVNTYIGGVLTESTDASGLISQYGYSNGSLTSVTQFRPDGTPITLASTTVDDSGNITSLTGTIGITQHFLYDANGNKLLSYMIDSVRHKMAASRMDYDAEGRLTQTRQYFIDSTNPITDVTVLDGQTPISSMTMHFDATGKVDYIVDLFGTRTETFYDTRENTVQTRTQTKDELGNDRWLVTRTAYDNNGRIIATIDPFLTDASGVILTDTADLRATYTEYDHLGRATKTSRLTGLQITLTADAITGFYVSSFNHTSSQIADATMFSTQTHYDDDHDGRVDYTTDATGLVT